MRGPDRCTNVNSPKPGLRKLLPSLPAGKDGIECDISLIKGAPEEARWPALGISVEQGRQQIKAGENFKQNGEDMQLGKLKCPGDPIQFKFGNYDGIAAPAEFNWQGAHKQLASSHWAVLRLIYDPDNTVVLDKTDPTKRTWEVTMPVIRGQEEFHLKLRLKFENANNFGVFPELGK